MIEVLPILVAAFVTGLLGSAHCLGMCAGISGLFAVGASVASLRSQFSLALAYNTGRVLSYAILGALIATIGSVAVDTLPRLAAPVRLASGILIVIIGLQVAFNWRALAVLEKAGAVVWKRIAPGAKGLVPTDTVMKATGLGLIWGWLPCGLVYSALLMAASTADPASGGMVMIAFGLGTMPAMIASGLSASRLSAFMSRNRLGAGILIIILGLATMAMPLTAISGNSTHEHHSSSTGGTITGDMSTSNSLRSARKRRSSQSKAVSA